MANKTVYPFGTGGQLPSGIGVINDLTTGGADKALSAEMGKEIGTEIYGAKKFQISGTTKIYNLNTDIWLTPKFDTISGHIYKVYLKSDALLLDTASASVYISISTIGYHNIEATAQQIYDGIELTRTWGTYSDVHAYIRMSNYISGVNLSIRIVDTTDPSSLRQEVLSLPLEDKITNTIAATPIHEQAVRKSLYIGKLLSAAIYNGGEVNTGASNQPNNVTMADCVALPKRGITIHVKAPKYLSVKFASGEDKPPFTDALTTLYDGDALTLPATYKSYRIGFFYENIGFTPSDVEAWLASGELDIYYEDIPSNILDRTDFSEVTAAVGDRDTSVYPKTGQSTTGLPTIRIVHGSDYHGDVYRFGNVLDMADHLHADMALLTGDFCYFGVVQGSNYVADVINKHTTPAIVCVGNHDTSGTGYTNTDVFSSLINPLVTSQGYESSSGVAATNTWFYRDFSTQKLRIISLNLFETNHTAFDKLFVSQDQIDWFIATLAGVPSGYGVIIAMHVSDSVPTAITGNEVWWNSYSIPSGLSKAIISEIVDAFISKTTISTSFVSAGKSGVGNVTVNVSGDFTSVASNEFICYCTGHTHVDSIGTVPNTTNKQLILCVTCGIPYAGSGYKYLANGSKIPRGADTATQDAFNVYGIDRVGKTISVARIGSNVLYSDFSRMTPFRVSYV